MTAILTDTLVPSYLSGQWTSPAEGVRAKDVLDASTGEVVVTLATPKRSCKKASRSPVRVSNPR